MEHDSSDEEWSDIEETEDHEDSKMLCLLCKETFKMADKCLSHMAESHNFNLLTFCKSNKLDFYDFIKLINYIRAKCITEHSVTSIERADFSSEDFLRPVLADDALLQIDFEGLLETCEVHLENGVTTVEADETRSLREQLKVAKERAMLAEGNLTRAVNDLTSCKKELQELLLKASHEHFEEDSTARVVLDESRAYFESYAHHGIHEEMLRDEVRTKAYRDFIMTNRELFKDKIVLDVGCGTGILSMFAASAGAKLVIAVDHSDIAYQAMDIIRENNLHEIIKVVKGDAEHVKLPEGITKVDIIISEWMGYFLLFESMLDSIVRCRDKWLCENGLVFPDSCNIMLAAVSDEKTWDGKVGFWGEVYGYKMSCMKKYALEEPTICIISEDDVCSNAVEVLSLDVNKVKVEDLEFEREFQMEVTRSAHCVGLVGYFNIGFYQNALSPINFSTGCHAVPTHWKQTLFLFEEKAHVLAGEVLHGTIECKKDLNFRRALTIKLKIEKEAGSLVVDKVYTLL